MQLRCQHCLFADLALGSNLWHLYCRVLPYCDRPEPLWWDFFRKAGFSFHPTEICAQSLAGRIRFSVLGRLLLQLEGRHSIEIKSQDQILVQSIGRYLYPEILDIRHN